MSPATCRPCFAVDSDSTSPEARPPGTIGFMPAAGTPDPRLDEAREAVEGREWRRAHELYSKAAAERRLEPEDLERLAKAAYWTGDSTGSISARESAYSLYIDRGDDAKAAFCALTLRREHIAKLAGSVAAGWLRRAEHLLEDRPEAPSHGYLAIARADGARARGNLARALALVESALEIAGRSNDANLRAWAVLRRGMLLIDEGRVDEGWPLMEEVAAAAVGAELGSFTTGAVLCNVVSTCRDLADYRRGNEWADATMRWCERQAITGFPGVCRAHRGEILRMLGRLKEAEAETSRAGEELDDFSPTHAAAAHHECGEVLLCLGEMVSAEEAFRRAMELGEDPQPGLALLRLAQGKVVAAATSIRQSLEEAAFDRFARARMLPAQIEIAKAAGDVATARAASDELAEIADQVASPAIAAATEWAHGTVALLEGDAGRATTHFRLARTGWSHVGAPIEDAKCAVALAEAHLVEGNEEAAAGELESARATFDRIGARLHARHVADIARRARPPGALGRAVRTFMFTDIVGSTSLIGAIGDEAWNDLRRWHDRELRARFAQHGGDEIDHAGDGFFLAFPDPGSAIECAVDIQQLLVEHRRTQGFAPQLRVGVHATAATRDEEGYGGLGVHAAARIAALAGPGEILASAETVVGMVGLETSGRRRVSLKGIADPIEVVAVNWRAPTAP
jgi:class 3 adenylate cyclase